MTFVDTPQSICRFAVARAEITPPVGIYHRMWGAATHDRSAGVHRPLAATAMFFQELDSAPTSETQQVLVALDHCLLGADEASSLLGAISEATGVARECIAIVFSHTHAAGLMNRDRANLPGGDLIAGYLENLNAVVADLALSAIGSAQEATITYGLARCDLAAHRDFWDDASRQWVCGYNPAGPADDTVLVARATAVSGQLLATMVNYACHPTTLAWDNQRISPDYPGAMREVVEQATGAPCVFLQGASGDLGPKEGFVGDVAVADRNGRQLGYAALSALVALPPPNTRFQYIGPVVSGATIGTWAHVPLPGERRESCARWRVMRGHWELKYRAGLPRIADVTAERERFQKEEEAAGAAGDLRTARDCRAMVERQTRLLARLGSLPAGDGYPYEIILWRMGDAIWLAVQGEPYNLLQTSLRRRFPGTPVVVAALAGSWGPSYLPPADLYGQGLYQESIAVVEAGGLERLIEEIGSRIEDCLTDR